MISVRASSESGPPIINATKNFFSMLFFILQNYPATQVRTTQYVPKLIKLVSLIYGERFKQNKGPGRNPGR